MNKKKAKIIAETISNENLQIMLNNAKDKIKDWTKISSVNKSLTKGTAWNILASDFDVNKNYHIMAKINMIREFGDYLPIELLPPTKIKPKNPNPPIHQDPIFKKYKLPVDYTKLNQNERKLVRLQYIEEQKGLCYYCGCPLNEEAPQHIKNKKIDWRFFPPNFLDNPIHLQHNHDTSMTEGAVHNYCNAVMWLYDNR